MAQDGGLELRKFVFCGKNSMAQCNMAEEIIYVAYILSPQIHVKSGSPLSSWNSLGTFLQANAPRDVTLISVNLAIKIS